MPTRHMHDPESECSVTSLLRRHHRQGHASVDWHVHSPESERLGKFCTLGSSLAHLPPFSFTPIWCPLNRYVSPHAHFIYFIYLFIYFIYLFLAALGLRCCAQASSSCSERGPLLVTVRGLLIAVSSLVAEHGL